jgi:hypothetical protein
VGVPRVVSLRSEPSSCNAHGSFGELLRRLKIPAEDVRIVDGTHCDPEDPTDLLCRVFCGGTGAAARGLYQRLLAAFLREALGVPPVETASVSWAEALRGGVEDGSLAVEGIGPAFPAVSSPPAAAVSVPPS